MQARGRVSKGKNVSLEGTPPFLVGGERKSKGEKESAIFKGEKKKKKSKESFSRETEKGRLKGMIFAIILE